MLWHNTNHPLEHGKKGGVTLDFSPLSYDFCTASGNSRLEAVWNWCRTKTNDQIYPRNCRRIKKYCRFCSAPSFYGTARFPIIFHESIDGKNAVQKYIYNKNVLTLTYTFEFSSVLGWTAYKWRHNAESYYLLLYLLLLFLIGHLVVQMTHQFFGHGPVVYYILYIVNLDIR